MSVLAQARATLPTVHTRAATEEICRYADDTCSPSNAKLTSLDNGDTQTGDEQAFRNKAL